MRCLLVLALDDTDSEDVAVAPDRRPYAAIVARAFTTATAT
jgi:hypothetical protein